MRFRHVIPNMRIIYTADDYEYIGKNRKLVKGLRIEFRGGLFDSLRFQAQHRLSDEERKQVEDYLLVHEDFNRPYRLGMGGLYLAETEEGLDAERAAEIQAIRGDDAVAPLRRICIYTIPTEEGSEQCRNEARPESDYCDQHYAVMAKAKTAAASKS